MHTLPIHNMAERPPVLARSEKLADAFTEAAHVCLDRHHQSPVDFSLGRNGSSSQVRVEWQQTDPSTEDAWEHHRLTECGACVCALAAVELLDGLVAVHIAHHKSGADYYVRSPRTIPKDDEDEGYEDCVRLEVSGVDHGSESKVRARVREKLNQVASGKSNLPAMVAVVGFKAALISMATLV